jgi:hypothetical protein
VAGGFGDDVEAVHFQPRGSSLHVALVHSVGGGDQVHHRGLPHDVAVAAKEVGVEVRERALRTGVDIRSLKNGRRIRGLRERGAADEGEYDHHRESPHHHSTSLAIYTNCEAC